MSGRLQIGTRVEPITLSNIYGETVAIPAPDGLTHLQFRRFAGCPVCNLHLQSFAKRRDELKRAKIAEVILFHSTNEELLRYSGGLPLNIIGDPRKSLYRKFGVESGYRAMLDPRSWLTILRAIARSLTDIVVLEAPIPPLRPEGGRWGLPADFLIDPAGVVRACHYGTHADDQWSLDELLAIASRLRETGTPKNGGRRAAA